MTMIEIQIPAELTAQQATLTAQLNEIAQQESQLSTKKAEIETSLGRLAQAIAFLKGEVVPLLKPAGVRKPMSEAGKANIGAALLRNSEAKRTAASAVVATPQPILEASAPVVAPASTAKKQTAKK